jgi:hypothetical protein
MGFIYWTHIYTVDVLGVGALIAIVLMESFRYSCIDGENYLPSYTTLHKCMPKYTL